MRKKYKCLLRKSDGFIFIEMLGHVVGARAPFVAPSFDVTA